jgi:hypothetical protein
LKTSKSESHLHGIGLRSVKQTVKTYGGEFSVKKENDVFNAKIMIRMQ